MVTTHAREVSTSHAGGQRQGADPLAIDPSAPLDDVPALPSQQLQEGRLAALAAQVQSLVTVVQGLQHQAAAAQQLEPLPSIPGVIQPSQHSARRRSPVREACHCHASPKPHRRKASKRPRSLSRHASASPKRRHGKETECPRRHHRHSFSSSESSREGSFDSRIDRRAERRLDEYNQRLEELSRRITNPPKADYDSQPPLSHRIMEEPISTRFRLPQLDLYDGTTDPLDHLESYKVLMQVQGAIDSLLCITFPATLKKAARAWYSRLPPRSIDSFRQLERAFLAHFDACRKIPRVADNLFSIQQKSGESLRDYVARFKEAALEVYNLEDSVATLALKRGLHPSRFAYSLDKKPSSSYAELLSWAQKYIHADEADSSWREISGSTAKKPTCPEPTKAHPRRLEPPRRPDNLP